MTKGKLALAIFAGLFLILYALIDFLGGYPEAVFPFLAAFFLFFRGELGVDGIGRELADGRAGGDGCGEEDGGEGGEAGDDHVFRTFPEKSLLIKIFWSER